MRGEESPSGRVRVRGRGLLQLDLEAHFLLFLPRDQEAFLIRFFLFSRKGGARSNRKETTVVRRGHLRQCRGMGLNHVQERGRNYKMTDIEGRWTLRAIRVLGIDDIFVFGSSL